MNIILNHKHDAEVQSQLDAANYYAHTRTVDIDEVYDCERYLPCYISSHQAC